MKKCGGKCKELKKIENFGICKSNKDGLQYKCKDCRKSENKQKLEYYHKNKETIKKQRKIYRNSENYKEIIEKYKPNRRLLEREKRKNDINFRCYEIMRTKFHKLIKGNKSCISYLNCDKEFFKKWIEWQFDSNMNWDNQGSYWQFDHIIPVSLFDFTKELEKKICFSWTNFQPLKSIDNNKKSNNIELYHIMNSIINIHRFIQKEQLNFNGYQILNESLKWLKIKLNNGKNPN